ncbi:uncharacterized protein LOC125220259 [Salvia hispanica]|uniref:uncharacterized protein LOC125220259 n=1 Tax=Salvia hispanica TaxID=49212 RepID=UPI0020094D88|nr:uncharacterized protein LOC125220259 [Salvia hispanica]
MGGLSKFKDLLDGVSKLLITYLGIPLGADPRKAQTWKPVIDKVENLFHMPKKVANRIIQLQRRFFWGKKEGEKGGCLISWETIQKPRSQGGLGVDDILIKNASLLFKWWWRFADNRRTLWKEIVESNHDTTHLEDFLRMNNKNRSCVWGQITDFRSFSKEKQDLVRELGIWVNGEWRWAFNWRRNLFAWEEESFRDLISIVNLTKLYENVNDRRVWSSDLSNSFSVSNFGLQVTKITEDESSPQAQGRLTWRNIAPPRAQLQVWFLLQGKINTKERLFRLGAARIEDDRCILCKEET